ncbi:MAG: glycosyl transferase [Acidiphilium sp. 37-67-22]|nr:MAG: glycosyl transferase [Acidiphilium sp. 37-67-22]HQT72988.1 glycosyltransferase [Acidiphilium sp.]
MKFLFVHQNFPGQYLHIVRDLLAEGGHEIVFMTEPNRNQISGVRKVTYALPPQSPDSVHPAAREYDMAMRRAEAGYAGAMQIRNLGFQPDIIVGHHGWGEMLNLCDVFPGVPILGYFEFYYRIDGTDVNYDPEFPMLPERFGMVRAKNGVNHLAFALGQHGQTPTDWQRSTYPDWMQGRLSIVREGVDLDICRPDPAQRRRTLKVGPLSVSPRQKLVTYVARNLEPYRGYHTFMRALPRILEARKDVVVSLVGGDEISYGAPPQQGTWRSVMMNELGDRIDLSRVHFLGRVPYEDHVALLRRSDAHVYLSYPFVASWSLREAMAIGAPIIGGDTRTITEFIDDGQTGLVAGNLDPASVADSVLRMLEERDLAARLGENARAYAVANLDLAQYLRDFRAEMARIAGREIVPEVCSPRSGAKPARVAKVAKGKPADAKASPARPTAVRKAAAAKPRAAAHRR